MDFLTRQEDGSIPRAVRLFRSVEQLGGGRSERRQLLFTPLLAPRLLARRYDVVLDLQNNRVSRTIRRLAHPRAWALFDRESPLAAGERTRRAIEAAGFPFLEWKPIFHCAIPVSASTCFVTRSEIRAAIWSS